MFILLPQKRGGRRGGSNTSQLHELAALPMCHVSVIIKIIPLEKMCYHYLIIVTFFGSSQKGKKRNQHNIFTEIRWFNSCEAKDGPKFSAIALKHKSLPDAGTGPLIWFLTSYWGEGPRVPSIVPSQRCFIESSVSHGNLLHQRGPAITRPLSH